MTEQEEREWQDRIAAMVTETRRKQAAKKAEREDHTRRRKYGKASYHAAKLARLRRYVSGGRHE